jgi:hypothetical protein
MVYYTISNKNYYYKNYKNGNKKRISKKEFIQNGGDFYMKNINDKINIQDIIIWIQIENVICKKYNERIFLNNNNNNKCSLINNCSLNNNCATYYSKSSKTTKCVSKNRIKLFEGSNNKTLNIKGKNNSNYKIINTFLFDNYSDKSYNVKIYCHIIEKDINDKKYLLIGFNCGKAYYNLYQSPEFMNYLNNLYIYILSIESKYDKIIICGHSMGCNTSMKFGLFLIYNNSILFDSKFIILGSGMANILTYDELHLLNNRNNILIFLNAIYKNSNSYNINNINNFYIDYLYSYFEKDLNNNNEEKINEDTFIFNNYVLLFNNNFLFKNTFEKYKISIDKSPIIHEWYVYYDNINYFINNI